MVTTEIYENALDHHLFVIREKGKKHSIEAKVEEIEAITIKAVKYLREEAKDTLDLERSLWFKRLLRYLGYTGTYQRQGHYYLENVTSLFHNHSLSSFETLGGASNECVSYVQGLPAPPTDRKEVNSTDSICHTLDNASREEKVHIIEKKKVTVFTESSHP